MDPDDMTQATQGTMDPRRLGRNSSGLAISDVSDVLCILHPCSPAAFEIVARTAERTPQHVLQNGDFDDFDDGVSSADLEEQETFILQDNGRRQVLDLALRFSSRTINPAMGFIFGRNIASCDIVLDTDTVKRVSNMHYRIFVNSAGVCMLQDMSTNGTLVDEVVLKGKTTTVPQTRMLNAGSIIQILSPRNDEIIKFIVRIPSREGHVAEYNERFQSYMQEVAIAEARAQQPARNIPAVAQTQRTGALSINQPLLQNQWGMHWNGGDKYNVVGHLGKGAFATVYRLATKTDGQLFAAKELEKRRFMKNGVLDRKLDNEMQIMQTTSHPNIVQYVDYFDHEKHLYIVMEYIPCGDLQQYLSSHGPLPEQLAKIMARQVFEAMAYLHSKKITHRDIKPDNILIANDNPDNFWVKLSDFGLSKVVKDNDTFLKTFCGTLLYCAPEVFPHYDTHVAAKGKKRTRRGGPTGTKFHSYSQSVDIWSFGAVLWFALCNKPPFEGVLDNTGRGMFEKIMMTPLDTKPLKERRVSEDAIELLLDMLNVEPSERPTPSDCLRDGWFADLDITQEGAPEDPQQLGLHTIDEDDEAEPDLSQLQIHEGQSEPNSVFHEEVSIDSGEFDLFDPRQSKRFKPDMAAYRNPGKGTSSSERSYGYDSASRNAIEDSPTVPRSVAPRRLFGEIGQSALNSSGNLGSKGRPDTSSEHSGRLEGSVRKSRRTAESNEPFATAVTHQRSQSPHRSEHARPDSFTITGAQQKAALGPSSLMGAESHMRDLNMESPQSANSPAGMNEPTTPRTPEDQPHSSAGQNDRNAEETPTKAQDETPKQPVFSRQINLPISASFFYDPNDPSTHNLEYATLQSGHDFFNEATVSSDNFPSLPPTLAASRSVSSATDEPETSVANLPTLQPAPEFVRPAPRLGRLASTPESFAPMSINLSTRITTWGRGLNNTVVYPDKLDTRIPKRGIMLYFLANGIGEAEESRKDWTKMPGLHCVLATESSVGLTINGVKLAARDSEGRHLYGKVYTGDVITVCKGLTFTCEFYHGTAREPRAADGPRFKVTTDEKKEASDVSEM